MVGVDPDLRHLPRRELGNHGIAMIRIANSASNEPEDRTVQMMYKSLFRILPVSLDVFLRSLGIGGRLRKVRLRSWASSLKEARVVALTERPNLKRGKLLERDDYLRCTQDFETMIPSSGLEVRRGTH